MMSSDKRNSQGIDVLISKDILASSPRCEHGPTLLFEKYPGDGSVKRFFACSAYRDRKHCPFYQPACPDSGAIPRENKSKIHKLERKSLCHPQSRSQRARGLKERERLYCHTCDQLTSKDESGTHRGHVITEGISDWLLNQPSQLLYARSGNKTQAQFLFSQRTTKFLVDMIVSLGFNRVLCVGVPRLHEALRGDRSRLNIDSLLLDIDERFAQFFPPTEHCRYNMFNHHFLDDSEVTFRSFVQRDGSQGLLLVMDPPFGGLVEALVYSVSQIMETYREDLSGETDLPVMWIFPYFLEKRIVTALPTFKMLDYKVSYENHTMFKNGSRSKKDSPVRIFTNIDPASVVLPPDEGYRFCSECQRYSAAENRHCPRCKQCPSKDGSTYLHCDLCNRCVKAAYTHCDVCRKCELPSHDCHRVLAGCHLCGDHNHKRKDCPLQKPTRHRIEEIQSYLRHRSQTAVSDSRKMDPLSERDSHLLPNHSPQMPSVQRREQMDRSHSSIEQMGSQTNLRPKMGRRRGHKPRYCRSKLSAEYFGDYITNYVKRRRLRGLKSTSQF